MADAHDHVHATAVAIPTGAALIRGPSGSGKSDLALRCLALSRSALFPQPVSLLSDDQVRLERRNGVIQAAAPDTLLGLLEVRGLGILRLPPCAPAPLRLVIDLSPRGAIERLPERRHVDVLGVALPHLLIAPFEHSAPIKLLLALSRETQG